MLITALATAGPRRPPGGGRFLFGLGHASIWVLLLVLAAIVLLVVLSNRRR